MAKEPKKVPESLWWDPFVSLFEELDRAPLSQDLPQHLVEKIKSNHEWFLDSVSQFKPANDASKKILESNEIAVGPHHLSVKPELREVAIRLSQCAGLDEVQSYIMVDRSMDPSRNLEHQELLHLVLVRYYLERQCLLKCIRRIFVHALYSIDVMSGEALLLINENLEKKLISIVQDLLSSAFSVKSDSECTISWVEETLIETNLIMEILFLAFYDNFSTCSVDQWKSLCTLFRDMLCGLYDLGKLAVSVGAISSFNRAKARLLFILIETLDLENLLRSVHDGVHFRDASCPFSLSDIQEIDAEISKVSDIEERESGTLILAWAVYLCLASSLPEISTNLFADFDHTCYVRQAFEFVPFEYLHEILCTDALMESDGLGSGYLSIMRTLISAFIASYELPQQAGNGLLNTILSILCQIYRSEETLCMQFWDRESIVDGPIRSLLFMLEKEFPFQIVEFVWFLSAFCDGDWPSQCAYNYLEKMSGITTLYQIPATGTVLNYKDEVQLQYDIRIIPGIEGIAIPSGARGYVLRVLDTNSVLVRWEFPHSGVFLLLVILARGLYSNQLDECSHIMDLFYRMISSNKAIGFCLLRAAKSPAVSSSEIIIGIENYVRIDLVRVICTSIFNLIQSVSNVRLVSNSFGILAELLKCAPTNVFEVALESNIFSTELNSQSSWILSSGLARMVFTSCEEYGDCSVLTNSVLDFVTQIMDKGSYDYSVISPLVIFALQHILVNHLNWKYKKNTQWRTTLKVLEFLRVCIRNFPVSNSLGRTVREIVLYDSSVHTVLWQIIIISYHTLENSYTNHHYDLKEIEDLQLVTRAALDIICSILAELPDESFSSIPPFISTLLSSSSKPVPFITVAISLISFSHNTKEIRVVAAKVLTELCLVAFKFQSMSVENTNLVIDATQINKLRKILCCILDEKEDLDENLRINVFSLLNSVASYQPALLVSLVNEKERTDIQSKANSDSPLFDLTLNYIERSRELINSSPRLLLSVLELLRAIWEGGIQFIDILEKIKGSKAFLDNLSACLSPSRDKSSVSIKNTDRDGKLQLSLRLRCQGALLEIIARELFLQERILSVDKTEKVISGNSEGQSAKDLLNRLCSGHDIEELVKSYTSTGYDTGVVNRAKIAICLCVLHLIRKKLAGNVGSLSISLAKKLGAVWSKLSAHPAFVTVLAQYSSQHHRDGNQLASLMIKDLCHHLERELEGQDNALIGPFHELSQFLSDLDLFQCKTAKSNSDACDLFDVSRTADELGFDLWGPLGWYDLVGLAQRMFACMHEANSWVLVLRAEIAALRALVVALSVYTGNGGGGTIPDAQLQSCIKCSCSSVQLTLDSLILSPPIASTGDLIFAHLSTHLEFLLTLLRSLVKQNPKKDKVKRVYSPVIEPVMKISCAGLRILSDSRLSGPLVRKSINLLHLLQLEALQFYYNLREGSASEVPGDGISGSLPLFCKYAESNYHSTLAIVCMDLILKGSFIHPNISLPTLQKHLSLRAIFRNLQNGNVSNSVSDSLSVSVILNFLLTLARTRNGAKLLHSANILFLLRVFLENPLNANDTKETVSLWSRGLSIITSLVYSLGEDITEDALSFITEKASALSNYLSAPQSPLNDKKRPRVQSSSTSLETLNLSEQCLLLLCALARYRAPPVVSELRENVVHLLGFISNKASLKLPFCPPREKEEAKLERAPPMIGTRKGWFGTGSDPTRYSEMVGIQIYRIALVGLSFLCVHAELAVKRAEEVGFVDLDSVPELPMPEIFHGLQDQAIAVITDVLPKANKSESLDPEKEKVCLLLLQVLERSLYLELCVSHLCGVRPVLGRIEDFSKEIKHVIPAVEKWAEFKTVLRSLSQIISLLYPGLLNTGDLL